jgi:hypothetical protein
MTHVVNTGFTCLPRTVNTTPTLGSQPRTTSLNFSTDNATVITTATTERRHSRICRDGSEAPGNERRRQQLSPLIFSFFNQRMHFSFSYFLSIHRTHGWAGTRPLMRAESRPKHMYGELNRNTKLKVHSLVKKLKINVKMRGEHNVKLN